MTGDAAGAFNPLTWVEDPVKCALKWAFVPDQATAQATMNGMQGLWDATPPGKLGLALSSFDINVSAGCGGIPYDVPIGQTHMAGTLINACAAPWTGIAPLCKLIVTVAAVIGCVVSISRSVGGVVAFPAMAASSGDGS